MAKPSPRLENQNFWKNENPEYVNTRLNESRPAGIRALVVYPMNALVEDQMSRMRSALCSKDADTFFREDCEGNRIYIGRYNGSTPVTRPLKTESGSIDKNKNRELAKEMNRIEQFSMELGKSKTTEWKYSFPIPVSNFMI